jgi:hypothetical protein
VAVDEKAIDVLALYAFPYKELFASIIADWRGERDAMEAELQPMAETHESMFYEFMWRIEARGRHRKFVEEVSKKVGEHREVEPKMRRVTFAALLNAIAEQHGAEVKALTQAGRQRRWVRARAMLVYMTRECCEMTVKELGKRLNRDPSIISRLYNTYVGSRDPAAESRLLCKIG